VVSLNNFAMIVAIPAMSVMSRTKSGSRAGDSQTSYRGPEHHHGKDIFDP